MIYIIKKTSESKYFKIWKTADYYFQTNILSDDNILIGSGCLITKTGADMVKRGATDLKGFVNMASENPARVLGLNKTGVIRKGAYADLIILDKELNVGRVFKAVDPGLKLLSECGGCCR